MTNQQPNQQNPKKNVNVGQKNPIENPNKADAEKSFANADRPKKDSQVGQSDKKGRTK